MVSTVRYLHFKVVGSYELINATTLTRMYNIMSLEKRRLVADLLFLHKIINSSVDSPSLLSSIFLSVPVYNSRFLPSFREYLFRTNLGRNGPLARITRSYNSHCSDVDIFHNSLKKFRALVKLKFRQ